MIVVNEAIIKVIRDASQVELQLHRPRVLDIVAVTHEELVYVYRVPKDVRLLLERARLGADGHRIVVQVGPVDRRQAAIKAHAVDVQRLVILEGNVGHRAAALDERHGDPLHQWVIAQHRPLAERHAARLHRHVKSPPDVARRAKRNDSASSWTPAASVLAASTRFHSRRAIFPAGRMAVAGVRAHIARWEYARGSRFGQHMAIAAAVARPQELVATAWS